MYFQLEIDSAHTRRGTGKDTESKSNIPNTASSAYHNMSEIILASSSLGPPADRRRKPAAAPRATTCPRHGVAGPRVDTTARADGKPRIARIISAMLTTLPAGPYTVRGISVGGVYTSLAVPELGLVLDAGASPRSWGSIDTILLSHGHADHVGALAA